MRWHTDLGWPALRAAGLDPSDIGGLVPPDGTPVSVTLTLRYERPGPGGQLVMCAKRSVISGAVFVELVGVQTSALTAANFH